jgi:hypothetical protein
LPDVGSLKASPEALWRVEPDHSLPREIRGQGKVDCHTKPRDR